MDEYLFCDLCGLNRATLHLDEVSEGAIRLTVHLCDDCWYRLGIRIPLGNIWRHIEKAKADLLHSLGDPVEEVDKLLAEDDLGELLDPGSLAVAEPDEPMEPSGLDLEEALRGEDPPARLDRIPLEPISETPPAESLMGGKESLGIDAVRVGETHPTLVSLFPRDLLMRCKAVPVKLEGLKLTMAVADPFDTLAIANIEMYLEQIGLVLVLAIADEVEILTELNRHGGPPKRFDSLS